LYSDQYTNNELPSLFDRYSETNVKRLTFIGIATTAITGILLPSYILLTPIFIGYVISVLGIIVLIKAFSLLSNKSLDVDITHNPYRKRFMEINIYALLVTVLVITTSVI